MIKRILLGLLVVAFAGAAFAQGIKRTPLQKAEFPDGYNTVSGIAEIPVGGSAGRHTHPGVEMGYLLEGEADLLVEGRPDQHLKAGDSYTIPAGTVHDAKVHGDKALKVLGVYVVDKTKPLASPAP
jgi:quercetin dioxygenase-like cupin family protein